MAYGYFEDRAWIKRESMLDIALHCRGNMLKILIVKITYLFRDNSLGQQLC